MCELKTYMNSNVGCQNNDKGFSTQAPSQNIPSIDQETTSILCFKIIMYVWLIHFFLYPDTASTSILYADVAFLCSSHFKQQPLPLFFSCNLASMCHSCFKQQLPLFFVEMQLPCVTVAYSSNFNCCFFILMQLCCITVALSSNCHRLCFLMQFCCVTLL